MEHKILKRFPIGNPTRNWKQDNFVLSNFAARGTNMRNAIYNCAEAGFNLLELGWASHEQADEAVALCEQIGVDLIFQDFSRFGGMQCFRDDNLVDDFDVVIEELKKWKHVAGFYIWDEPLLDDQLEASRILVDFADKHAPDRLGFTVAIPSYNLDYTWDNGLFPDYLERYVNIINPSVLSLDYYPFGIPGDQDEVDQCDKSRMWCDLGIQKLLCDKYDLPLWFYYQGMNLHEVDFFIFPMIRSMMYAGALYGAKGLQHFTAVGAVIDADGNKEKFFDEQKAIHEEFRNLGETLMALSCKRVIHDDSVVLRCEIADKLASKLEESAYLSAPLPHRVSVSEFEDEYGNGYMMILNRDYMKSADVELALNGNYRIYNVSKTDGLQHVISDKTDKLSLSLEPGDAALVRLQSADEEAYTIEYRLSK